MLNKIIHQVLKSLHFWRVVGFSELSAGVYDQRGLRITYIVVLETIGSISKGLAWLTLTTGALVPSTRPIIILGFLVAALASILVTAEHFKTLDPCKVILKA